MNVVVTGASGFVGRCLVRRLTAGGCKVLAIARGQHPDLGADVIEHELGGSSELVLPAGYSALVHLAQSRTYRRFPEDAAEMFRVNVAGTQALLDAAVNAGLDHFCYVSSGTVYEPYTAPLIESAALAPLSYLGASKFAGEVLTRPYAAKMKISVLRLFAPYGPGQTERLVPDLVRRVANGAAVTLPLSGGGMRFSPTHVDDVCDVIAACLGQKWSGTYNVASARDLTIEDAANLIGHALGRQPIFERKELASHAVVPVLDKLAARYDLNRLRGFADGVTSLIASA